MKLVTLIASLLISSYFSAQVLNVEGIGADIKYSYSFHFSGYNTQSHNLGVALRCNPGGNAVACLELSRSSLSRHTKQYSCYDSVSGEEYFSEVEFQTRLTQLYLSLCYYLFQKEESDAEGLYGRLGYGMVLGHVQHDLGANELELLSKRLLVDVSKDSNTIDRLFSLGIGVDKTINRFKLFTELNYTLYTNVGLFGVDFLSINADGLKLPNTLSLCTGIRF